MKTKFALFLLAGISCLSTAVHGQGVSLPTIEATDWPQFLGPARNGASSERQLNLDWQTKPPKISWKVPLGAGYSGIAVVGDRLYTQVQRNDKQFLVCLDANDGHELWSLAAAAGYLDQQRQGPGPRATPTVQDDRVYALFPGGELLCATVAGKQLWKTNIFKVTKAGDPTEREKFYWGMSVSPLIVGDLVVVQPGGEKDNCVAAFSIAEGRLVWSAGSDPPGYGATILANVGGQQQLISYTGTSVLALSPDRGKQLWRLEWGNKYNCNCATPLLLGDKLFISAAYGTGSALLDLANKQGDQPFRELWTSREMENQFATCAVIDGHAYGPHGDLSAVTFRCLDLKTGKRTWAVRKPGKCTLITAAGHIIVLTEKGDLLLINATPEKCDIRGEVKGLLERKAWTPPSLSRGRLYVRDEKNMACVDLRP